jgi:hypothetical protein
MQPLMEAHMDRRTFLKGGLAGAMRLGTTVTARQERDGLIPVRRPPRWKRFGIS